MSATEPQPADQTSVTAGPFARPVDCDYPGSPTVSNGRCRCIVCARCDHHTGNSYMGHHSTWCRVTEVFGAPHFCCPDNCELQTEDSEVSD